MNPKRPVVRFGVFEADLAAGELFKQGRKIKLQEQPFQALALLLDRPREVISREEFQKRLWPDTVVDFDRGLNKTINRLREVLGDDADNPRFIETVPQRGYRFLVRVESDMGEQQVSKQVDRRRAVYAIAGGLVAIPILTLGYRQVVATRSRIESLAVLPLQNLSNDPEQEYFSDGVTDELITEIAGIVSLRVTSRTSVMRYKGDTRKSLPEIARELDVDAILTGTVAQAGGRVRINVNLVRARDDTHLWTESYERDLSGILTMQSEVARAVARSVRINLASREQARLARKRSVNPAAYEAFLRGNYFLHRGIPGVPRSVDYFTQAVQLDDTHADSYAGLGEALVFACIFGLRPSADGFPAARAAAQRALELDESNAAAHNVLADVKKGYDWDLAGAEVEYQRAMRLNPSHLLTRVWYAECLTRMKRYDEALREADRYVALDPVSPISANSRAMLLFRARRYQESIERCRQALELDPQFVNAFWWLGLSHAGLREYSKAIEVLTKALSMSPGSVFRSLLGHVYGLAGENEKALRLLVEITAMAGTRFVSPMDFAILHAGLGDTDATFKWLEQAYTMRAARMHEIDSMYFDRFRSDPRYSELVRRAGLSA